MLNNFVLNVALRYFSAKKNEKFVSVISAFSLLGVTIGVAALIVVMSVMQGFHNEFVKNIIGLKGDIRITPRESIIDDYQLVHTKLSQLPYITRIVPSVDGQALALGSRATSGVMLVGTDIADLKHKNQIVQNVIAGSFVDFHGKDVVALGSGLAYKLGARAGDTVKLISPNVISTAFGSMPRSKEFKVVAVFSSGIYDYDEVMILMPLQAAQNFLSLVGGVNLIELYTKDPDAGLVNAATIQKILGNDFMVNSWQQSNMQLLNALAVERAAMFAILSLIIVVAAFNIISSLFMLVKDKTKDIAILKTMGASQRQMMLIFMCNGMFIGLIGTVLGGLLGTSFAYNIQTIREYLEQLSGVKLFDAAIYLLYNLPSDVRLENVALVSSLSFALCMLATIYPSYKASKLNPVDALRYE